MNKILLLVLIVALSVIGISGFIYLNTSSQKSFSDGSITFNYPGSFQNGTSQEITSEGWIHVITLNHEGTFIYVQKNELNTDPEDARQEIESLITNSSFSGEVVSHTKEINPNGIEIFKGIYTLIDPTYNEKLKYVYFYFKDKKGVLYNIIIYDYEKNYKKVSNVADIIFNSLILN